MNGLALAYSSRTPGKSVQANGSPLNVSEEKANGCLAVTLDASGSLVSVASGKMGKWNAPNQAASRRASQLFCVPSNGTPPTSYVMTAK
jgi:hypothetical protein